MRFHTYAKFSPESADAVDLQSLLDNLADFLLQSGFAGGGPSNPWGYEDDDQGGDRSMDALRQAILEFAKWRHTSRAIAKDRRLEFEAYLQGKADAGAFGSSPGVPGSCMVHVPFERRYGGGRAACLR